MDWWDDGMLEFWNYKIMEQIFLVFLCFSWFQWFLGTVHIHALHDFFSVITVCSWFFFLFFFCFVILCFYFFWFFKRLSGSIIDFKILLKEFGTDCLGLVVFLFHLGYCWQKYFCFWVLVYFRGVVSFFQKLCLCFFLLLLFVLDFFLIFFFLCYSLFLFFPDFLKDFQGVSLTFKYYSRSSALIALALF